MFTSVLPSTIAGQAALLASLVFAAFALVTVLHGRLRLQNRRLLSAINNMSQGLNMFDANGRITLLNTRYLQMYKLSPEIVKPGCTLKRLIEYRKETGFFSGDEAMCRKFSTRWRRVRASNTTFKQATAASFSQRMSRCRAAAGSQRTKTSPNSVTPNRNEPPFATRSNGARTPIWPSHHSDRLSRNCSPL